MTFELRFKKYDQFEHAVFSTYDTPDAEKNQSRLTKMAKRLDMGSYNPIYVNDNTALVTTRNRDLRNLIPDAIYRVTLTARVVNGRHANIWVNRKQMKLISKPDLGEIISFDDDDDDEDED